MSGPGKPPTLFLIAACDAALASAFASMLALSMLPDLWARNLDLTWYLRGLVWASGPAAVCAFIWLVAKVAPDRIQRAIAWFGGLYNSAEMVPALSLELKSFSMRVHAAFWVLGGIWLLVSITPTYAAMLIALRTSEWARMWWPLLFVAYLAGVVPVVIVGFRVSKYAAVRLDEWLARRSRVL